MWTCSLQRLYEEPRCANQDMKWAFPLPQAASLQRLVMLTSGCVPTVPPHRIPSIGALMLQALLSPDPEDPDSSSVIPHRLHKHLTTPRLQFSSVKWVQEGENSKGPWETSWKLIQAASLSVILYLLNPIGAQGQASRGSLLQCLLNCTHDLP